MVIRNQDVGGRSFDQEVCWNWFKSSGDVTVSWNSQKGSAIAGPYYEYRNTVASVNDKASFKMAVFNDVSPTEELEVISNVIVAQDFPHLAAQLDTSGSTDAAMESWLTNGTFSNTFYESATQTEVNITTGLLQNAGLAVLGTDGAEISA